MEVCLIRHTTPKIEKGICYGHTDLPLHDSFAEEVLDVLKNLPERVSTIYTSPLVRCLSLAQQIGSHFNAPVLPDDRLKELNFGAWEMKPWEKIDQSALMFWMNNYIIHKCPQGESYHDLSHRVLQFIHDLHQKDITQTMIVTHGGVIRTLHTLAGYSVEEAMKIKVNYGQVFRLKLNVGEMTDQRNKHQTP